MLLMHCMNYSYYSTFLFNQNFIKTCILFKMLCLYAAIFIHLNYRILKSQNLLEVRGKRMPIEENSEYFHLSQTFQY